MGADTGDLTVRLGSYGIQSAFYPPGRQAVPVLEVFFVTGTGEFLKPSRNHGIFKDVFV